MPLETLNTLSSIATAAIIAATAIAALIQLRHVRAGNLITALLTIENEMDNEEFRSAEALVREELPRLLADRDFCKYCFAHDRHENVAEGVEQFARVRQAAVLIANTFENLGALVKRGIFDRDLFLDIYANIVASFWSDLAGFTALRRNATGITAVYENFEYIAAISRPYLSENHSTYPRGIARLALQLPSGAAELVAYPKG